MDYLHDKYRHDSEFTQWLALHTDYQQGQSASVASFLKAMATQTPSRTLAISLLKDLSQTLESLQQAHAA